MSLLHILHAIRLWEPIRLDALGLVTLLGAASLRQALGRLVCSGVAEHLPLLAAQIVADNSFAGYIPGFTLYNITDKIVAEDLSAWFTRWLLCQNLTYCSSTLFLSVARNGPVRGSVRIQCVVIAALINSMPICLGLLTRDWYGFACAIANAFGAFARSCILHILRQALDEQALKGTEKHPEHVKVLITLPNGRCLTVFTTRGLILECLLTDLRPPRPNVYLILRGLVWLTFGVSIVTIGLCCLTMQLLIIALLMIPSLFVVAQSGCDEGRISSRLRLTRNDVQGINTRAKCYAGLNLTAEEEEAMVAWHLFPLRSNQTWWQKYRISQAEYRSNSGAFEKWPDKMADGEIV